MEVRKRRLELMIWAFVLSLAFYPEWFGFLAWFALVRPLMIIARLKGRDAFWAAYLFGFFFNLFTLYWIAITTPPGMITAVTAIGFYYAAGLYLFNLAYRFKPLYGMILVPFIWVGIEYFRTITELAFPWSDIGYTQAYYLYILQIISIISIHGLSLLIVGINVLIWQVFRKELEPARRLTAGYLSVAVVVLLVAYGWIVTPPYPLPGTINVTVLQGSVPINVKWAEGNEAYSYELYDSLARSVADSSTLLYLWPETSVPTYLSHDSRGRRRIGQTARATNAYHVVGSLGASQQGEFIRHHNSSYLFEPDGSNQLRHDKVKLVPFTEQVPYQRNLPFLRREFLIKYLTFIETYDVNWWSDFVPGDSAVLFPMDDYLCGVMICYEAVFPEYPRELILKGADFLVGITNDTWWEHTVGVHMHARFLVARAVENRCWMARSANSGLSFIVDGYGRIRSSIPEDAVVAMKGSVRPIDGFTPYTRIGDIAGLLSFLITISLSAIFVARWLLMKLMPRRFTSG